MFKFKLNPQGSQGEFIELKGLTIAHKDFSTDIVSSSFEEKASIVDGIINRKAHPIRAGDIKSNVSSPAQESAKFIRLPSQEVVAIIPEKLKAKESSETTEPEYGKAEPPAVVITIDLESLDFAALNAQINLVEQNASSSIVGSLVLTQASSSMVSYADHEYTRKIHEFIKRSA